MPGKKPWRQRVWVLLFLASGCALILPVLIVAVGDTRAAPWVLALGAILALSGYRIWRVQHPASDVRLVLAHRAWQLMTFAATVIGGLLAVAYPALAVVVIGVCFGLIFLLFVILAWVERSIRR